MEPRILLLLDMNGTICYRSEERVAGNVREDLYIRHKYYYKRRGIEEFVKQLASTGHFKVAVYSSMMSHNIQAGLNAIMNPQTRQQLLAILDRGMNKPDPTGKDPWDTVRDMRKVWRRLPEFGPKNTLLLDNEARKFAEDAANGIVVPEFGAAEVLGRKTNTLDSLTAYLLKMGESGPSDVREYLRSHPFDPSKTVGEQRLPHPAGPATAVRVSATTSAADELASAVRGLQLNHGGTPRTEPPTVPSGTALHLVCIENGCFKMTGKYTSEDGTPYAVQVKGDAGNVKMRIDTKMDFNRLVEEADAAGCQLDINQESF
ncbi:hypothetical protein DUNSADRAFT_6597 [Dunaliella salina]|uniref:Mitochondrial import inner membrane translocase subunit TIM50 n=1 Tax=Dunaliella salina TaxID=3046 RepID=A0ABQ7GMZ8_DUNSA|nr:hypothetical protein DUNSADRAFT_6597 [Dunaliella salina]|eukprot:KAF5835981.1 hypothetical protein DUNSADRAFT_6597 [Dunaliella salina]